MRIPLAFWGTLPNSIRKGQMARQGRRSPHMKQHWFSGPEARFALQMQKNLLQHSLAVWPRRGATLLDVNCGAGLFLPLLWECGFDVTGAEHSPELRNRAVQNAPVGTEIQAAAAEHLPYADNSFDWVVLHLDVPGRNAPESGPAPRPRQPTRAACS